MSVKITYLAGLGYMLTQVFQARRLESGQSSANVSILAIVETMERERKQKAKGLTEETAENEQ